MKCYGSKSATAIWPTTYPSMMTGTVIDVVAVLTRRRVGTGVHLDLARA